MTTEQKAQFIENINAVIETMSASIERMEQALAARVLRGENTLLVTEDGISAVTILGDKYCLRSISDAAFFSPKGAAQMVNAWNEANPEMKIVATNWRTAYEREIKSYKAYIEDYRTRMAELQ